MSFLALLAEQFQSFGVVAVYVLAFLAVLTIVVFVHELGHFLVARWCGVTVSDFAIGFGREIFGFTDRHGTRWKFCWIPLGGYVKFMDDENAASAGGRTVDEMTEEERAGAFHLKPIWQRSAVVAAGPIANFIFAIIVFALVFWIFGVRMTAPKIDEVVAGMPAAEAGLQAGDVIRKINGTEIRSFNDVQRFVGTSIEQPLDVTVDRGGEPVSVVLTPVGQAVPDGMGGEMIRGMIGVRRAATPESYVVDMPGPIEALGRGVTETGFVITATLGYVRDIFVGRQNASQIGGLPHIAEVTRRVIDISPERLPYLIAMISVAIGLMNLFPIPILDGGHLMFYAIEAIRRKPLSERTQDLAFRAGFAVLISIMIFANVINGWPIVAGWFGLRG